MIHSVVDLASPFLNSTIPSVCVWMLVQSMQRVGCIFSDQLISAWTIFILADGDLDVTDSLKILF